MTHLGADTARGTACGHRGLGDGVTLKRQLCTCSGCLMHVPAHDAYLKTLAATAVDSPNRDRKMAYKNDLT